MKTTTALLGAAALGSAFLVTGGASAAQQDRATGGGQVDVATNGGGAGDTIAFTARGTADSARGQVQYIQREGGTGQEQTVLHGTVTCIVAEEDWAKIAGVWKDGSGAFTLYVKDNGEGQGIKDGVTIAGQASPTCDFQPPQNDVVLARGNAQVFDADGS